MLRLLLLYQTYPKGQ